MINRTPECRVTKAFSPIRKLKRSCFTSSRSANTLSKMKTGLVGSLEYKKHQTGLGHPETTRRIDAVLNAIEAVKLDLHKIEPRKATTDDLLLTHTADYIAIAQRDVESGLRQLSTGDTTDRKSV